MKSESFVYVTYIATTAEKLFVALTDGRFTREYWGGRSIESDWKPGAEVHFRKMNGETDGLRGQVLEFDSPRTLSMSWGHEFEPGKRTAATRVTFTIHAAGPENVKLTVVHEPYEAGSTVEEMAVNGWQAILSSLKTYLETGKGLDVVRRWAESGK